ncbi:DUF1885 family protein [Bacillus horti]|uniref:DUF1885 family protein n=1 Tax=Caldalkalibacillus horti TaxID=77523 RepID=A0ABT9W1J6_9BACI|nr:DUF1885 family protein [Bacillus horti]MDQ0166937.1 hypothetical protein [Bacillus horti]
MGQSAYIRLVDASTTQTVQLQDIKDKFHRYIDMTTKTGNQLDWGYAEAAFPYTLVEKPEGKDHWFYLKGSNPLYKYIVVGVGTDQANQAEGGEQAEESQFIQVVLPDGATHGDKSKANEFCKYLAKEFKAQLDLFNGRRMYYYPRKP